MSLISFVFSESFFRCQWFGHAKILGEYMEGGKFLLVANWKEAPASLPLAVSLARALAKNLAFCREISLVVCPPAIFLPSLGKIFGKKISLGSQGISPFADGAHTGEISAEMFKSAGATFCLVGHSERRSRGETNADCSAEMILAYKANLTPILCVGEKERDPHGLYLSHIKTQILEAFEKVEKKYLNKITVAYEPVWAIGQGRVSATKEESLEMAIYIRRVLTDAFGKLAGEKALILYGGSVNSGNALSFLKDGGVSGLLIGRESLSAKDFGAMAKTAEEYAKFLKKDPKKALATTKEKKTLIRKNLFDR